jgi:hypothetical protein
MTSIPPYLEEHFKKLWKLKNTISEHEAPRWRFLPRGQWAGEVNLDSGIAVSDKKDVPELIILGLNPGVSWAISDQPSMEEVLSDNINEGPVKYSRKHQESFIDLFNEKSIFRISPYLRRLRIFLAAPFENDVRDAVFQRIGIKKTSVISILFFNMYPVDFFPLEAGEDSFIAKFSKEVLKESTRVVSKFNHIPTIVCSCESNALVKKIIIKQRKNLFFIGHPSNRHFNNKIQTIKREWGIL